MGDERHEDDEAPARARRPTRGEGGPKERARSFGRQRSAVLRPADESGGAQDLSFGATPGEEDEGGEGAEEKPPSTGKEKLAEYRRRQRQVRARSTPGRPRQTDAPGGEGAQRGEGAAHDPADDRD